MFYFSKYGQRLLWTLVFLVFASVSFLNEANSKNQVGKKVEVMIEAYLKGIRFIATDFFQVSQNGKVARGKFWLSKDVGRNIKVVYTDGIDQEIIIKNNSMTVFDKSSNKRHTCSISQTPIYIILDQGLDLSRETYDVPDEDDDMLKIRVMRQTALGRMSLTLIFSKYQKTGNIKNIEGWIIDDGKMETLVSFAPETLFVNDKGKIPSEVLKEFER